MAGILVLAHPNPTPDRRAEMAVPERQLILVTSREADRRVVCTNMLRERSALVLGNRATAMGAFEHLARGGAERGPHGGS